MGELAPAPPGATTANEEVDETAVAELLAETLCRTAAPAASAAAVAAAYQRIRRRGIPTGRV
jgi:hypothetical protein